MVFGCVLHICSSGGTLCIEYSKFNIRPFQKFLIRNCSRIYANNLCMDLVQIYQGGITTEINGLNYYIRESWNIKIVCLYQ